MAGEHDITVEMLRLVVENVNMGAEAAAELERQGEQIDKIRGNLLTWWR